MATKTKKKKLTPEAKARRVRARREDERRGLWVVQSPRMKQYGDQANLSNGQVIRRLNLLNDSKLERIGYVKPLEVDDEFETCGACGKMYMGTSISGPYSQHLARARHDLAKLDLDEPSRSSSEPAPRARSDEASDPDTIGDGVWDLEPDGAPAPTKEDRSEVRIKLGEQ